MPEKVGRNRQTAQNQRKPHSSAVKAGGHNAHQNQLPDPLPRDDFERLSAHLELIPMQLGDVLYEPGIGPRYVYSPTTSIASLLYVMEDGASAEIAIVGNEGILGIWLFMGGDTMPSHAVVQRAWHGFHHSHQHFA